MNLYPPRNTPNTLPDPLQPPPSSLTLRPPRPQTTPQATTQPTPTHPAELRTHLTPRITHPIRDFLQTHLHLPLRNSLNDIDDPKRTAANRPKDRNGSHAPQDESEVEVIADVGAVVGLADGHGENGVADHPRDDHVRPHSAIVVLLLLKLAEALLGHLEAISEISEGFIVAGVDVELFAGHLQLDGIAFAADRGPEVGMDDIVAFRTPGHVVGVAKGVHLKGTDVGRKEGEVLCGGGEHVPWVEIEEGHEEVDADGGGGGDDEVREDIVAEAEGRERRFELRDDYVEGGKCIVGHDDGVDNHTGHEHLLGSIQKLSASWQSGRG